jgi:hypothetical protein
MASTLFSVGQENSIRIAAMYCLTVGGAAWISVWAPFRKSPEILSPEEI